jgi:DNA-binding response OmpR family regulator
MTNRILVVEDEAPVRELLTAWLSDAGYQTCTAGDGVAGLREVYQQQPDLIVADIVMPKMDGFEFCRLVKEVSGAPIMFLTGLGEEAKKVKGLNMGADDYVVKPVGMEEFLARVGALLRRYQKQVIQEERGKRYADPVLAIDKDRHEVTVRGGNADLTPTEFRLLWFLTQRAGKTCAVKEILEEVWGSPLYSSDVVKWHVASLRGKLETEPHDPVHIITVWGVGYRYDVPRVEVDPADANRADVNRSDVTMTDATRGRRERKPVLFGGAPKLLSSQCVTADDALSSGPRSTPTPHSGTLLPHFSLASARRLWHGVPGRCAIIR